MKRILIPALLLITVSSFGQKTKTKTVVKGPVATTTTTSFKNFDDSLSYAIGLQVAQYYKQQNVKNLNGAVVMRAVNDVFNNKPLAFAQDDIDILMMEAFSKPSAGKARQNVAIGKKFLAENKRKDSVKTTASGLQYKILREGSGPKPTLQDTVVAHYAGTLLSGEEFDNSYKRGEPLTIPVGGVIKGWTEALLMMSPGAKYRLYIPYNLAYGLRDMGNIPPGSTLLFDVELISIKPRK